MVAAVESVIAAARNGWEWVLDDDLGSSPRWRLAWALHGMPRPLPRDRYRDVFRAFETRYGVAELVAGLNTAATLPVPHGADLAPEIFASLARQYERARGRSR